MILLAKHVWLKKSNAKADYWWLCQPVGDWLCNQFSVCMRKFVNDVLLGICWTVLCSTPQPARTNFPGWCINSPWNIVCWVHLLPWEAWKFWYLLPRPSACKLQGKSLPLSCLLDQMLLQLYCWGRLSMCLAICSKCQNLPHASPRYTFFWEARHKSGFCPPVRKVLYRQLLQSFVSTPIVSKRPSSCEAPTYSNTLILGELYIGLF